MYDIRGRGAFLSSPSRSSPGCRNLWSAVASVLIGLPVPFSAELMLTLLAVATMLLELREAAKAALLLTRSRLFEADMVSVVELYRNLKTRSADAPKITDEIMEAAIEVCT